MWWSPGILVAGVLAVICFHYLGTAMPWWIFLVLLAVSIIVDAMCGVARTREVKHKTRTVYRPKDKT